MWEVTSLQQHHHYSDLDTSHHALKAVLIWNVLPERPPGWGSQWHGFPMASQRKLTSLNRNPEILEIPGKCRDPDPALWEPGVGWRQREWRFSLRQRDQDLHVVDGEEAGRAVYHALVPVLIYPIGKDDDVTLLESKLAFALWLKVVKGAAARLVQHLRLCLNRKHPVLTGYWAVSPHILLISYSSWKCHFFNFPLHQERYCVCSQHWRNDTFNRDSNLLLHKSEAHKIKDVITGK